MGNLISAATAGAIAAISPSDPSDTYAAFRAVGIDPIAVYPITGGGTFYVPDGRSAATRTLQKLDLADSDVVARVLRYTARVVEMYAAQPNADQSRLVRLRHSLTDDGYSLEAAADPVTAIADLAAAAGAALSDAAAIRLELTRLERALPDDAGAAISRAKNLVEATAKAVLTLRGKQPANNANAPALARQASEVLGVHATQAGGPHPEQVRRILGRLEALTNDLAELRNQVGDGHGMTGVPAVDAAAGRLAARAAIAWCAFMLEVAMGAGRTS